MDRKTTWIDVRKSLETREPSPRVPNDATIVSVVGVSFIPGYPQNLLNLHEAHKAGDISINLVRVPKNHFDKKAIEVRFDGRMLGHIPREKAAQLAPKMDAGVSYVASVFGVRISPNNPNNPGLDILLEEIK